MSMTNESTLPETIRTPRLALRPYRFSDVLEMYAYLQEPDGNRYLEGTSELLTKVQTEAIVARHILADPEQRSVWAMTLSDLPMGAVSINFEKARRIAEVGYHTRKSLWGRGYATEAVSAVVQAAFANCSHLQRIQANIHPDNAGSIKVAERVGMAYEGTLRSYAYIDGKPADEAVFAIVRGE